MTIEDRLYQWLHRRQVARMDSARRAHAFIPRYSDANRCGHVFRDDGYSDPDYCDQLREWHTGAQS